MKKVEKNITLKEFKELHSKRQSKTLTPFEKYRVMYKIKKPLESIILIHLYTKFLHFDMKEFYQRKFDIQGDVGLFSEKTITNNLSSLEKKGYFTQEFKQVKGKNYNRIHFNINIQKLNELLTTGDELKPENFSKLIETLRRQNEVVKSNPYNKPKGKTVKSIEEVNHNNSIATTYNPTEDNNDSDSKTHKTIGFKDDSELVGISFEDFEDDKPNDNKTDIKTDTLSKEDKIINNNITKQQEIMNVNETPNEISTNETEDFNEKTKILMKYQYHEGIKPVLDDLRLSFQTINNLYSDNYVEGADRRLDDKRATLEILYDIKIKPLINK